MVSEVFVSGGRGGRGQGVREEEEDCRGREEGRRREGGWVGARKRKNWNP